jgi:hypothetical protein
VKKTGTELFKGCTSLKNVVFEEGFEHIETHTFSECTSLEKVSLPSTLTTIFTTAMYFSSQSVEVTYNGTYDKWTSLVQIDTRYESSSYTIVCIDGTYTVTPEQE